MSATVPNYRWSTSEFVRAWEAGAFDSRVEFIEGELWPVVIGGWHGWAEYWVVTPEVVYVHTAPHPQGYRLRREFGPGEMLPVRSADSEIAVSQLLAQAE